MIKKLSRNVMRQNRHIRMRQTITGTASRPRLSVYRSNKGYYVQLVDDLNQSTIVAVRSQDLGLKSNSKEAAKKVGQTIAEKAKAKGITSVVFDRSGYLYHGRIQVLADAAREAGLVF
jgi:large subunit ribosomal protein L18